ncbi:isoleucine--tRNA ligase [Gammaproteobacteria bacterium]|nr:isoleucine--tRNA ligase [Gammaproteobacteria bacterium]MDA8998211.1 isoleucine--tRNA ligase [Gammaproteobacteria bacterium]MDA9321127.1 isoleucine--tRNA ligase [Gammaproteobacteria bacterium]MDB0066433.1 isoleucine--tRNA ligase [Gammaproteobacteria bacterium]MDB9974429.1 isoleucine--tRNA ligase [Gammaproteobacteria bacterium]
MKAGLPKKEPEILDFWNDIGLYEKIRQQNLNNKKFILHDGPPYANGAIHLGHSVNKILKDITIKSKTLQGLDAPYVPGWDCHGLPIELNVEKKYGKRSELVQNKKMFQEACKEYALTQIESQKKDFIRLGVLGEWDNPYKSLDSSFEANAVRALGRIYEAGHIEKGEKPVHWCQDCGSALAEAEVEYQDKTSKSIDVAFKANEQSLKKLNEVFATNIVDGISFVIWTTTPWTIPSNVAVCINPELDYALIKLDGEHLVIAEAMIELCMERWGTTSELVSKTLGKNLVDISLIHPFIERNSELLHGDHVTTEAGTGCVHTAPAHGLDDYFICKKHGIETFKALNSKGFFKEEFEFIAGLPASKADPLVIEKLNEVKALVNCDDFHHSYPHCWRHKSPLIFTSTAQWFISMNKSGLLNEALQSISGVSWEPSWGEQRIEGMLTDRPDWCISRQRNWGVPITLVVHKESGAIHPNQSELFKQFANLIEENGISSWESLDLNEFIDDGDSYIKITDSLDVWFDSGITHFAVSEQRFEEGIVADLYLEGSDQHRGWFQSSLLTSIAMNGRAPYKAVLTHGFVVDENGRKQSKSLGNVVSPQKVWDSLGADILRLWVASADFRSEMVASDEILKRVSDQYRRIRNTFRFILGNLNDFDESKKIVFEDQIELDKWIVLETSKLQEDVLQLYESYSYHNVVQKIHNFCVNELGGIYLDIVKDRLYTCKDSSLARQSCQTSLNYVLNTMVRLTAPILSFTSEEIWQTHPSLKGQNESIFLSKYFESKQEGECVISSSDWARIFEIKDIVNQSIERLRNENKLKGSLDSNVIISANEEDKSILEKLGPELHFVFISSQASVIDGDTLSIQIDQISDEKCTRCWHRDSTVGESKDHPEICSRCEENIDQLGESRSFV